MGTTNSQNYPKENDNNTSNEEFNIIKNNLVYNIKLSLEKKDESETIKVIVSFVINNTFQIYEAYLDQCLEIGKIENYKQNYQNLIEQIKNENIEIIHDSEKDEFILLKLEINQGIKTMKLLPSNKKDEIKFNELIKNYKSLEENYIQIKKAEKNNKKQTEFEDEQDIIDNDSDYDNTNNNINIFNNFINTNNDNSKTTFENSDKNHIILNTNSSIWCMINLNKIPNEQNDPNLNLNLVAIGFSMSKIIIIDLDTMSIYQEIITPRTVYSLAQFKGDPNYLICSLSNGQVIIYKLKDNRYEEHQILEKPENFKKGEINKVITLSNGDLATVDRGSLSIWKPRLEEGEKKFEFFKELITNNDTCHLLEVNPQVFACAVRESNIINVYKNDGNEYPLLGKIENAYSHGSNSNGMAAINDNIFCSGGTDGYIYIVSIEPVQVIQKIMLLESEKWGYVQFINKSNDGFIFTSVGDGIIQYKIINNEDGNFIKLEKFDVIEDGEKNKAIALTEDGKIFYMQKRLNNPQDPDFIDYDYDKTNLFLTEYKK